MRGGQGEERSKEERKEIGPRRLDRKGGLLANVFSLSAFLSEQKDEVNHQKFTGKIQVMPKVSRVLVPEGRRLLPTAASENMRGVK